MSDPDQEGWGYTICDGVLRPTQTLLEEVVEFEVTRLRGHGWRWNFRYRDLENALF